LVKFVTVLGVVRQVAIGFALDPCVQRCRTCQPEIICIRRPAYAPASTVDAGIIKSRRNT